MPSSGEIPTHLIEICVGPKSKADQERLTLALRGLAAKDSTLSTWIDQESGQTILAGQSEVHLARAISELRSDHEILFDVGAPQVAYLETLGRPAEVDYTHRKATSPAEFARVRIVLETAAHGSGFTFERRIADGVLPEVFVAAVRHGLEQARLAGILAGFPLTDFRAILVDAICHDLDSSALAFELAARGALKELRQKGAPLLLWPIMKVEVTTPVEFRSDVLGTLIAVGAQVLARDPKGPENLVQGFAPLANLLGFGRLPEALSCGQASIAMRYDHRGPVPPWAPEPDDDPPFRPAVGMRLANLRSTEAVARVIPFRPAPSRGGDGSGASR